jgi:glycosyltransferase involved in cell wall biosynthesis
MRAETVERSPTVTVAIPVYNERTHLRRAVESVLAQTFGDFELIVVDDGSTDGSLDTIADLDDPRIRRFRQENGGKAAALNRALDAARGEFFCLQDADDEANPGRLSAQVAAMRADPELGGVFCRHELIVDGRRRSPRVRPADREECARAIERMSNPALDPTIMVRLSLTRDQRFAEDLRVGEGEDHLLRVGERHPMVVVAGCHYAYRVHEGNGSKSSGERTLRYRQEVLRRASQRRGIPPAQVRRPEQYQRVDRAAHVTGHVVASTLELRALGRQRQAIGDAAAHLRGAWRYPSTWLPLLYAVVPTPVLRWRRPDLPAVGAALAEPAVTTSQHGRSY